LPTSSWRDSDLKHRVGGVVLPLRLHQRSPHRLASHLAIALSLSALPSAGLQPNTNAASVPSWAAQTSRESRSPLIKPYSQEDSREIEPNTPIERDLAGGETHYYRIASRSGQYTQVVIDQRGVDVVATVFGPDSDQLAEVDRPSGSRGPEAISYIAQVPGVYRLRLRSLEKSAGLGRYQVRIKELRDATERDESRITAEKAVTEGERLRAQGTADSLRAGMEKFQQALALWRFLDEPYEQAVTHYGIGLSYRLTGEYQKAVESFRGAISLMRKVEQRYGEAVAQTGLAWTYLYLGDYDKALYNFTHSLSVRRSVSDPQGEALALYGIGWVYSLLKEHQKALDNFLQSLLIRQAVKDRRGEALTLSGIGNTYSRMGRKLEALDYLNRSLEMSRSMADRYSEANILSSLGWVYTSLKETQTALDYFQKALSLRREVGDRTGEATTLHGIAQAEKQRGNLLDARSHMETSLAIIDSLRNTGDSQHLRISYLASVQEYYEAYIDLLISLDQAYPSKGYASIALEVSERARARGLLDLLAEAKADIRRGVDSRLLKLESQVQQRLNAVANRQRQILCGKHTVQEAATAAKEVEALTIEYQDALAEIRRSSPQYAALTQPQTLSAGEIQRLLDERTMLVEYAMGDERSYGWAVTPTSIECFTLPGREEIETTARRMYQLLTARNQRPAGETAKQRRTRIARSDAEYIEKAGQLSEILLGPIAAKLGAKRLVIVAQGALQLVPFGALPVPAGQQLARTGRKTAVEGARNGSLPSEYRHMITDHEIVSIPSASTLAALRQDVAGRKTAPKAIAVIADPVFNKNDDRLQRAAFKTSRTDEVNLDPTSEGLIGGAGQSVEALGDPDSIRYLPRLFETRWEADQIVSLVPSAAAIKALDFAANRAIATSSELGRYRVVHFATHALINDVHPELSGIALSLVDEQGKPQDGFLRVHDIFNLKLPVELVVLSACRTGLGKDFKGEGLLGMTRAFMYAGTPRVVVSLWSVNDKASADLMVKFYRSVLDGEHMSPAAALRSVQMEMSKTSRWQSPYYWGAFVLQGEWR
jgi:CHAT domain-containing protein/Tfp pilus assembly protein PilF